MTHVPDDEQTLLDSRFGASRSGEEFKKMGLPDRPRRRRGMLALSLAALVFILILQFSGGGGTGEADRLIQMEASLDTACSSGDWTEAVSLLAGFPAGHRAHAAVPHLRVLERATLETRARHWERAYELLADFPRQDPGLPVVLHSADALRRRIASEVQARDLILGTQDDIPALKTLLQRLDPSSVYRAEIVERLDQLESFVLADHESQLESAIQEADFDTADAVLKSWSSQLPGHDASAWMQRVNVAREARILRDRIHKDILAGQFLKAMAHLASSPNDDLKVLKAALEEASASQDALTAASVALSKGDFDQVKDILDGLEEVNAVKTLFNTRAMLLETLREDLQEALEDGKDARVPALQHCRSLITHGVPGEFLSRIAKLEAELSAEMSAWAEERRSTLRQRQDEGDYLAAYEIAGQLLAWGGASDSSRDVRAALEKAGEHLLDEIYILSDLDRSLAADRLRILESCLPPDHELVVRGRSYLRKP